MLWSDEVNGAWNLGVYRLQLYLYLKWYSDERGWFWISCTSCELWVVCWYVDSFGCGLLSLRRLGI